MNEQEWNSYCLFQAQAVVSLTPEKIKELERENAHGMVNYQPTLADMAAMQNVVAPLCVSDRLWNEDVQ